MRIYVLIGKLRKTVVRSEARGSERLLMMRHLDLSAITAEVRSAQISRFGPPATTLSNVLRRTCEDFAVHDDSYNCLYFLAQMLQNDRMPSRQDVMS